MKESLKTEMEPQSRWQFWIDRGGTFTDIVACSPEGELFTRKQISGCPEDSTDPAVKAIRDILGIDSSSKIPAADIKSIKMGTTVATNALLEREGARTALVITRGFGDALRIAYQNRPRLFDRRITLPQPLYEHVIEVRERTNADGRVLESLDIPTLRHKLQAARLDGIDAVAIVFMHGYRYPEHERKAAIIARETGFDYISVSHEVAPLIKLVSRGETTVADAYLSPKLHSYINETTAEMPGVPLMFMQSNGGLTSAGMFRAKDSILSGPAGGVVGMSRTSSDAGFATVIGFDMGGTSTDVSHYRGELERSYETEIAGVRVRSPMIKIHSVAAGGGSILHFDGIRYQVGPDSAGADPGPACYRRGGPLTVTDINVMLGKIQPDFFPHLFGTNGDEAIDVDIVKKKFDKITKEIRSSTGDDRSSPEVAEGFLRIAVENMANAIKKISIRRGYDVTDYTLCCFGGAGGQHACLVADALGMKKVFIHSLAGVLSAYGMGLAEIRAMRECSIEVQLSPSLVEEMGESIRILKAECSEELSKQEIFSGQIVFSIKIHLRYEGSDTSLAVDYANLRAMAAAFEEKHRQRFGFIMPGKSYIVEAVSVEAVSAGESLSEDDFDPPLLPCDNEYAPASTRLVNTGGVFRDTPFYLRDELGPGFNIQGPAVLVERNATTVVEPGWVAEVTSGNNVVINRCEPSRSAESIGTRADPVMLEIFNNIFTGIAEQMGEILMNTARSVNIKERLDFSCAIFDESGSLVASAPHIPVHLGSMSETVRAIIQKNAGRMKPGDAYLLNSPFEGGTHLPDMTVVTPVFDRSRGEIVFFTATRGHHADVGGKTPGSMPPDSRRIDDEGILINNFKLVEDCRFNEENLISILSSTEFPARDPRRNIADLRAQIAANEKGARDLTAMTDHFGIETVHAYMNHIQCNAAECVRRVIDSLEDGKFRYEMDDGAIVQVTISINKEERCALIDFTGTSPQLKTNFNAPVSVSKAAVLYVFRSLIDRDIPLNDGCLEPVEIIIPPGSMLNPRHPSAVAAGNVETSQHITDALYGALGVLAASQGTMNNFTFGNSRYQYYETICGGSGAGSGFDGTDAVHTHMTNSRLTDPEVLESRFPVMIQSFS